MQVLLEGTERGVRERAAAAAELLGDDAGEADLDTADVARLDGPSDAGLLVKVAVPLTGIARLLHTTREIEDRLGLSCGVVGSAGVGVLHVQLADVTGETCLPRSRRSSCCATPPARPAGRAARSSCMPLPRYCLLYTSPSPRD